MHTLASNSGSSSSAKLEMATPISTPVGDQVVARGIDSDNSPPNKTIWFWLGLFVTLCLWSWAQHRNEKINKELEPQNILANLHNIAIITFAAVVGIVGGKVLFTKLAAICKNIPVIGRLFSYLAQLFGAA